MKHEVYNERVERECNSCYEVKPLSEFYFRNQFEKRRDCKACHRKTVKEYQKKNPLTKKQRKTQFLRFRERSKINSKYSLINRTRQKSRRYNLPYDLKAKTLHIPDKCPYTNIMLDKCNKAKPHHATRPAIIPIQRDQGYVPGNIMVVSNIIEKAYFKQGVNHVDEIDPTELPLDKYTMYMIE